MSFKEFDMSEYYNVLEEFKTEHEDKVIKMYGSVDRFNEHIEKFKAKETEIAKEAIKHYGSIKKFTEALKKNLNSDAITKAEQIDKFKKDCFYERHLELKELYKKLTADLSKDPSSEKIQQIAGEITNIAKRDYEAFKGELGDYYWLAIVRLYLNNYPKGLEKYDKENGGVGMAWIDERYGEGASKFIGKALKIYLGDYEPEIEKLYKKLIADLSKDPTSKEIQQIVSQIADEMRRQTEILKVDEGENNFGYMAELYLTKPIFIKSTDKKYGDGAAKFIGEAFKFYSENNIEK